MSLEPICGVRSELGEGPRWHDGVLTWVDIERCTLHRWDGAHSLQVYDRMLGCANPTDDGDVVLGLADRIELAGTGEVLARFAHGDGVRANDGACDPAGRLWIGSMALDERPGVAALYRLDGAALTTKLGGLTIANGIGWSPDGTRMYYVDTPTKRIDVYEYDGELGARRTLAEIDGFPDGLCVDDEGCVWIAVYGGARIERRTPDGELDRVVRVPEENPTACCFGGSTLFVTTARGGGYVYACDASVTGPPAQPFRRRPSGSAD
jgi:sugar lactone lactonase YvrE